MTRVLNSVRTAALIIDFYNIMQSGFIDYCQLKDSIERSVEVQKAINFPWASP